MNPEDRDWIDRAISGDGMWEPPAHFVERVAVQAFQRLPAGRVPRGRIHANVIVRLRELFDSVREEVAAQTHGSLWVLRQYREVLLR